MKGGRQREREEGRKREGGRKGEREREINKRLTQTKSE